MRLRMVLLVAVIGGLSPSGASAQSTCFEGADVCHAACTPGRVARYFFGSYRRCSLSCTPRLNECLRTGIWVDLERYSTGRVMPVDRF